MVVRYEELVGKARSAGDEVEEEVDEVVEENVVRKLRVKVGDELFEPNVMFSSNAESLTEFIQQITEAITALQDRKEALTSDARKLRNSITASLKKIAEYMENIRSIEGDIELYKLGKFKVTKTVYHKPAKEMKKDELLAAIQELASNLNQTLAVNKKSKVDQLKIVYTRLIALDDAEQKSSDEMDILTRRLESANKQLEDEIRNYESLTIITKYNYDEQYVNRTRVLIAQTKAAGEDTITIDTYTRTVEQTEQELEDYIKKHTYIEDIQPIVRYVHAQELTGGDVAPGSDYVQTKVGGEVIIGGEAIDTGSYQIEYYENELVKAYVNDISTKILVLTEQKKQALDLLSMYVDDLQTRESLIELSHKLTEAFKNNQYYDAATGTYVQQREYDSKKYSATKRSMYYRVVYLGDTTQSVNALAAYMNLVQTAFEVQTEIIFLPIVSNLIKSSDKEWIYLPIGTYANNNKVTNKIANDTIHIEDKEIKVFKIRNNQSDVKYREYLSEVNSGVTKVILRKKAFGRDLNLQGYFDFKMNGFARIGEEEYIKMKEAELLVAGELKSPSKHTKDEKPEQVENEFISEVYLPTMDVAFYLIMSMSNMVDRKDPLKYPTRPIVTNMFKRWVKQTKKIKPRYHYDNRIPVGKRTTLINQGHIKDTIYIKSKSSQTYLPVQLRRIGDRDEIHIYEPYKREWTPIQQYVMENSLLEVEDSTPVLYVTTQDGLFQFRNNMRSSSIFFNTSWIHPTTGILRLTPAREKMRGLIFVSDKTINDIQAKLADLSLHFAVRKALEEFKQEESIKDYMKPAARIERRDYIVRMISRIQDFTNTKIKNSPVLGKKLLEFEKLFSDTDRVISHENKVMELELYIDTVLGNITYQSLSELWSLILDNRWPGDQLLALTYDGFTTFPREKCDYIYMSQIFARIRNSQTLVPVNTAEFSTLLYKQVGFEMAMSRTNLSIASLMDQNFTGLSEQERFYITQYRSLIETHSTTGRNREEVYRQLGVDPYMYSVKFYTLVEVTYKTKKRSRPIPIQHRPEPISGPVGDKTYRFTG